MTSSDSHLSYRPLTVLTFCLQHSFVGFDKLSFHGVNIVLHALVCTLLMWVCEPYLSHRSQRQLVGLLFALHAVHVESVTGIVGRSELLSALLFLCAVLCHHQLLQTSSIALGLGWLAACISLAGLAMLCKEVGITALLVCGAIDWGVHIRHLRRAMPRAGGGWFCFCCRHGLLAFGALSLLLFRLWINDWRSPTFSAADNSAAFCPSQCCRGLTYCYLYWINLR